MGLVRMKNYYNENDPKAAAWLRELIRNGLIPDGHVDTRSISDVQPADLAGVHQCHFFAGIGGWPYALRLAGFTGHCWTGSCPCQPFSVAGGNLGRADPRHLWPNFRNLIGQCRPPVVFGEQVAGAAGRDWLSGVRADLEALGYAVGAADLCAASVSAPHVRQRLFWVADAAGLSGAKHVDESRGGSRRAKGQDYAAERSGAGRMADRSGDGRQQRGAEPDRWGAVGGCGVDGIGNTHEHGAQRSGTKEHIAYAASPWGNFDLIPCSDGKSRRIESGTFPLAHGVSGRVGKLRGYGNAIVPQVAAEFVKAFLET